MTIIDNEKYPGRLGVTLELCPGIVDKQKPLAEIAQEEVLEECGYQVPLDNIGKVTSYRYETRAGVWFFRVNEVTYKARA